MDTPLWTPSPERAAGTNMTRFISWVREHTGVPVTDYASLYQWSTAQPEQFWPCVWDFCGVRASRRWDRVVVDGERMPGARWFKGAMLNFAENLLVKSDDTPAIITCDELGRRREVSWAQLARDVALLQRALRQRGVNAGDRIAGYLPNVHETVVAMLATASLGAVWSSCSPDFGVNGVLDRFGQIRPKVIFTTETYFYNGKRIECLERMRRVLEQLSDVETVVIVPYLDEATPGVLPNGVLYAEFLGTGKHGEPEYEPLSFNHPLYILYSSGTTGAPKCLVHGVGGTLLQHMKELVLHTDLKPVERIFYYTTCGWMMWNWLVTSLAVGATIVLYDGAPFYPQASALMDIAQRERVNVFGASARYLAALEKAGVKPARSHDLSSLRTVLSTGSPLAPESFEYVYRHVKGDVQLASISGGTDIISCFALGNPAGPVYRGELQCRGLGMKVEVFNEQGRSVFGEKGELVCTAPFPSMPVGFWNDPDGTKYRQAYFDRFPGVWAHGDYAEITEHGGMIIYGRSDAVLNPAGVRIGTAEITRQVETLPEVLESLAVGQEWDNDVRVVLFVKLREGLTLDDDLRERIRTVIRNNASPRHVPAKLLQVPDLPRTLSGKLVELAVRNVIHDRPVKNLDALANPEALAYFRDRPELRE
ncbi:acetoacetate--CoA ligase [Candidatus Methylomirabilis sp.]|uniref:acetoacetate--CoA ligase n=1 Tax=Candidatus Methylomirabilis sp. TaxID=2032687 RepID=UPI003076220C